MTFHFLVKFVLIYLLKIMICSLKFLYYFYYLPLLSYGQTFTLQSKDLGGQATMKQVFKGFGCEGENISPQLSWVNAPKGSQKFCYHDSRRKCPYWQWLVALVGLQPTCEYHRTGLLMLVIIAKKANA
jgi:hypothetical protein